MNYQFNKACSEDNIMFAKKLLYHYPQINISFHNEQPFRSACSNGCLEICKWLLEIKPSIDISVLIIIWKLQNGFYMCDLR